MALDATAMQDVLRGLLARAYGEDGAHEVVSTRLVEHKRGLRALYCYELVDRNGGRRRLLGKQFAELERAARLQGTLSALHAEVSYRNLALRVPRPLGWIRGLSLVVFEPVDELFLDEEQGEPEEQATLRASGRALADLHSCRPPLDRRFDPARELSNLRMWARAVDESGLGDAGAASSLVDLLQSAGVGTRLRTDVPIHKDLHYRHMTVGSTPAVIDFDEIRWGDPSFDLAHYCTYLELLGLRLDIEPARLHGMKRSFLDGYSGGAHEEDERFRFFGVYTCMKIARQLCLGSGVAPIPTGAERRRQVRTILELGRRSAEGL